MFIYLDDVSLYIILRRDREILSSLMLIESLKPGVSMQNNTEASSSVYYSETQFRNKAMVTFSPPKLSSGGSTCHR